MSSTAVRALVVAGWRERWNRRWRFSPAKAGLWVLLFQIGLAGFGLLRMLGVPGGGAGVGSLTPGAAFLVMALQGSVWSFMLLFLTGRGRLYGSRSLPLVHISPAPDYAVPMAQVLAELPGRAWSMLLWAVTLGAALPPGARLWAVPALWVTGMLCGACGQLAGTVLLVAWVRVAPRLLAATWAVMFGLQAALLYYLIYLLVRGMELQRTLLRLVGLRWWLGGGLVLLFGLPGLIMLLSLSGKGGRPGDAYRDGWLGLADLGDRNGRRRRSFWPGIAGGPVGAVQAREWLYAARNPFTWFRLAVTAAILLALTLSGDWLKAAAAGSHDLVVPAVGVGTVFLAFGEMAAAVFSNESGTLALHVVAGVRPGRLLLGKLLAVSPLALLAGVATGLAALAVGDSPGLAAVMALRGALTGLGMAMVIVGMGGLDGGLKEQADLPDLEGLAAALEQAPRGPFSMAGLILAGLFGAGLIAWPRPEFAAVIWAFPALCLLAGWFHLRRIVP